MQGLRAAEGVVLALGRASVGVGGAKDATNGNPETKNGTTRQQRQNNPCATDLFSGCPTAGSMASVARLGGVVMNGTSGVPRVADTFVYETISGGARRGKSGCARDVSGQRRVSVASAPRAEGNSRSGDPSARGRRQGIRQRRRDASAKTLRKSSGTST